MAQSHIKLTGGVGDGSRIANSITQSSHGFVVGQAIRYNRLAATGVGSNKYVLAKADEPQNSEVIGVVSSVVGADNFTVTYSGEVDISTFASGFTLADDDVFFLSDTTEGLLTKTPHCCWCRDQTRIGSNGSKYGRNYKLCRNCHRRNFCC